MSVKSVLESYKVPELRLIIRQHNKKVQAFIKDELKEIREKFKKEKLIKVTGMKNKSDIINEMLKHETHFKNVPVRPVVSTEEQNEFLSEEMQPKLNKLYREYKADGDLDELTDGVNLLYKLAKTKDLKPFQSKKKMIEEIKKDVADEKAKEPKGRPPRPAKPPLFVFKDGRLVLVSLLESLKLRPKKPTRKAPGKLEGTHEMKDGSLMTGETHNEDSKPLIVITDTEEAKPKAGGKPPKRKIVKKKAKEEPKKEEPKKEEPKKEVKSNDELKELKKKLKKLGVPNAALKFIKTVERAKEKIDEIENEEPDDKSVQVSPIFLKQSSLENEPKVKKLVLRILPRDEYTIPDQLDYLETLKQVGEDWFSKPNARQKYNSFDDDEKALFELLYPSLFDKKKLRESGEAQREKRKEEKKAAKEAAAAKEKK